MADIGYQAPQTTAQDILSYKGDPAMAGGYDSKGNSLGLEGLYAPVNDMLKQMQGQAFQRSMVEYNQRIKDRDSSLEMMKDPRLNDLIDVADEDKDALEKQRQAIIDQWKSNPSMDDMNAYGNFQKSVQKFSSDAQASKSRNLERKKQLQEIAKETNPAVREEMLKHLDEEVKKGVGHQITPYFKQPTFDAGLFADVPAAPVGEPTYVQDETGAYHAIKTQRTPVKAFADFIAPDQLMANHGERLQKIQSFYTNFKEGPFAQDANTLTAMNSKLANINATNNLKPGMAEFLQPIAQQGQDGKWNVNQSPAELAKSFYAYSKYSDKQSTELAPDYQKQVKVKAEIEKDKQQESTSAALEQKYRVEAEEAKRKGDIAAEKAAQEKEAVSAPATDAYNMFKDVSKYKTYTGAQAVAEKKISPTVLQGLKSVGFTEDMQITPLPITNNYRNALAVSQPRAKKDGTAAANGNDISRPSHIIAFRKPGADINDVKLVGFDKAGKFMKAIDINEAAGELIKANNGYKASATTQKQIDAARAVTNHLMQGGGAPAATSQKQAAKAPVQLPEAIKKISPAAVPITIKRGTFYQVGDKFYDANGDEVK